MSVFKHLFNRHDHVTIQGRITRVIFISCLVTLFLCLLFATLIILFQHSLLKQNGEEVGTFATRASSEAILKQSIAQTEDYIHARAVTLDDYLKNLQDQLVTVKDFIESLYAHPNRYQQANIPHFSQVPDRGNDTHYYLGHGASMNSSIRKELALLGNTEYMVDSIRKRYPEVFSIHIYTESGLAVDSDSDAPKKQRLIDKKNILSQTTWYKLAKANGKVSITDTYKSPFDDYGNAQHFTVCAPFYNSQGELLGVIGAEINLGSLSTIIKSIAIGSVDLVMLLAPDGIITHSLFGEVSLHNELDNSLTDLKGLKNGSIRKSIPNYRGNMTTQKDAYIVWETLTNTNWQLVGFAPIAGIISPAEQISKDITAFTAKFLAQANTATNALQAANLVLACLILGACIYLARRTARRVSTPIVSLTNDALKIGQGDLDYTITMQTGDEIETLANTINKMVTDIKHITGEKERIEAELGVATQIQRSMLPSVFPPYLFGFMRPAKEVGGDFYDFYFLGEHKLAVVIADVSGKGIPAALFMVTAKNLLKSNAPSLQTPSEIFYTVNNLLCENNDADMFVTTFMGILDLQTNVFTYVNAGHNPPLYRKTDGTVDWLKGKRGLVLGGMEGSKYTQTELALNSGDMLFFYTDGVTEAVNKDYVMFAESRLHEAVNKHHSPDLKTCVESIVTEIDSFATDMEQADDITILLLHVR